MDKPCYPKLHKAIRLAIKAHKDHDREGASPIPYATHPIDVVNRLRYTAGVVDEDLLCAAALHDVLEDTKYAEAKILKRMGSRVHGLVKEMTREEPSDEVRLALSPEDLVALRSDLLLKEVAAMSPDSQKIKLADRASNVAAAKSTRDPERLNRLIDQTHKMLKIIPRKVCPPLWDEISTAIETGPKPPKKG